jgi:nicotinamide phosphoribosyltransferase
MNPFLATDGYKVGHHRQYPQGTTLVYSNFTPRSNKYAPKGCDKVVSFGQQMVVQQIKEMFDEHFFSKNQARILYEIKKEYSLYLDEDYDVSHIKALHELGYLPIKIKAIPEGTLVPMGVPVLTIYNTKSEFYWLTNFLEVLISNLLWKPMTSATIAHQYKKNLMSWAEKTDKENIGFVEFQGHDFSMRGMDSVNATISSGLGHTTSFKGSDSLPVIYGARKYYGEKEFVIGSVNATEHSVICAGTKGDELGTFRYLMKQFPTGILSIVSDTWDLWTVITKYLPELKEEILARDGRIVIRPDSGDPVDIICGPDYMDSASVIDNFYENLENPEEKGVIQLLWDIFGGTINKQGYKVLDPHIGAIYGDSITLERAEQICKRLEAKGFASTNIILGIGSFTYQYNTRDTFGFAMKATYVEVQEGVINPTRADARPNIIGREIFKDPITDDGTKKSAKGLLRVQKFDVKHDGRYQLKDQCTWEEEKGGALQTIFEDGEYYNQTTLTEIRQRLGETRI